MHRSSRVKAATTSRGGADVEARSARHDVDCPVRRDRAGNDAIEGGAVFKTIVLGLDGSESSDHALQHATMLAREQGSSVRVVHVIEISVGRGGGLLHLDEDEIKAKIEQQTKDLVDAGVDAELELHSAMAGSPAHVIAEVAERSNADLIITGTRGRTAAAGILLGSVAQRLLHVAHCPLLVIPSAKRAHVAAEVVTEAAIAIA
jgi:nucleotide-binding universal stress UspA family protein